jgi:mannosyltransferase
MSTTTISETRLSSSLVSEGKEAGPPTPAPNAILVGLVILLSCFLRLHGLTAKPFWLDEAISVNIARMPWSDLAATLWHREANMAFYYVILHLWLSLGHSEAFIRALSVLFSVATIPVIYALAARLFNGTTGLLAAFLLSINAFHIRYAQEARGYALVMFCATLATWLLVRNLQEPQSCSWSVYAAVCALTVYCHFYGMLVIVAHGVALVLLGRTNASWKGLLRSLLWFSLLMIPIALFIWRIGTEPVSWVQPLTFPMVLNLGFDFSGNYGRYLLALDVFAVGIAVLGAVRAWDVRSRVVDIWEYTLVFLWLLVPLSVVISASLVKPLFVTRYLSPCMPALIVLVAAGIARLRPPFLAGVLFAAIVGGSMAGTISYYHADFDVVRGDWRAASRFVLAQTQPGDTVFFYQSYGNAPFEFYRWQESPSSAWPKSLNPQKDSDWSDPAFVGISGTDLRSLPAGNRVWLVWFMLAKPDGTPDTTGYIVRDWFAKGRHRIAAQMFTGVSVALYGSSPDPPSKGTH